MSHYADDHSIDATSSSYLSAQQIVPFLLTHINPRSVIDFGCGQGAWLAVFEQSGILDVLGIDGDYVDMKRLLINRDKFLVQDLAFPKHHSKNYDLAICLEVAEHLPAKSSEALIEVITHAAPVVLFSAAVPNQPGDLHVNCQWPEHWAELFFSHNYAMVDCIRLKYWENPQVDWWYSQNTFVYVSTKHLRIYSDLLAYPVYTDSFPAKMIHPELYNMIASADCQAKVTYWHKLKVLLKNIVE